MTKKTNETIVGETVETTPEVEEMETKKTWKKVGKYAAIGTVLVGIGLALGVAIASAEDEEDDETVEEETTEAPFETEITE